MKNKLVLLFTIIAVQFNYIQSVHWWLKSKAQNVGHGNFTQITGQEKHVIIDYFIPPCIYCQQMVDEWNQIVDYFDKDAGRNDILITKMNCHDNQDFCREHHIHSFPAIKFYPKFSSQAVAHFHGGRTYQDFKQWIEGNAVEQDKLVENIVKQKELEKQQQQQQEQKDNNINNEQQEQQQLQVESTSKILEDSEALMVEIQQQLNDGLGDAPKQVHQNKGQQNRNFSKLPYQEKAELLFDEIHSASREMQELNVMNKKNLDILHKTIEQADVLQDERIDLQKEISVLNEKIDSKKDGILDLVSKGYSKKNKKLSEIESTIRKRKNTLQEDGNQISAGQYLGVLIVGLIIGYIFTLVIYNIQQSGKKNEDTDDAGQNEKLY